jgi:enamine deaminase RidA (YjgF/YER057c/UK114 family)
MNLAKETRNFGVPWEAQFGYAQAVRMGDWIYVSGQLSHDDEGQLVAPAPLDASGAVASTTNMAAQLRQAYANMGRLLRMFELTPDSIVEEVIYALDVDAAFAQAPAVRREFYGADPRVACTMLGTPRLAFREQLVEIKFVLNCGAVGDRARQTEGSGP